jgi:hypothetical protein
LRIFLNLDAITTTRNRGNEQQNLEMPMNESVANRLPLAPAMSPNSPTRESRRDAPLGGSYLLPGPRIWDAAMTVKAAFDALEIL